MRWRMFIALCATAVLPLSVIAHHGRGAATNTGSSDPTVGLVPTTSDAYANWSTVGLNAIPLTGSISGTTLTVTYSPSKALGPSQTITCTGCSSGTSITAYGSGTGGTGTYTVSPSQTVSSQAMTAAGIPNRTTIYATLSPSGGNDTSQIQTALNACPAGEVVLLSTGVFQVNGASLNFGTSSCTLRGSGVGALVNTGINAVGDDNARTIGTACTHQTSLTVSYYCPDSTATQIIQVDRASNPDGPLIAMSNARSDFSTTYALASNAVQGSYSVTLTSAPGSAITAGQMVWLDENTLSDPNIVYGPSFAGDYNLIGYGERATDYSLSEIHEVVSVSGSTVTFDSPVQYPFQTAYSATLTIFPTDFVRGAGIENVFLWGGMGGNGQGNIGITRCAYCWVKNVESAWSQGGIQFTQTFRNVLRDSFMHETPDPTPGGLGYLSAIDGGASENLFENNIMWYGNKENVIRLAGQGNVVAYNYMDDAFDEGNPGQPEAGVNSAHLTTSHHNLIEGNYSQNFKGDTYWGNAIYITVFRNWLSAHRAAHAPLNTYVYSSGCNYDYGDWSAVAAVDVQAGSYDHNFIGNVLGKSGQALLTDPNGCAVPQAEFVTQVTTASDWNSYGSDSGGSNAFLMWQFGAYQATVNQTGGGTYTFPDCSGSVTVSSGGGWTFDHCTINTQTRLENWDWYNQQDLCYGFGSASTAPCTGLPTLPSSFYLTSRPAFFGSDTTNFPWPWVNPASGVTTYGDGAGLPAMYCFQQGKMPTCTLP